ncbi:MAG TPA: hypothetical protein PLS90_14555 [Candidatus Sumerlaeota bacterium]|nr:hypothetical protein [Candidatus Sumerlaeota bacterium]
MLANWLVPGLGFLLLGKRTRGLIQLGLVGVTFALGLLLDGGVAWPAWSIRQPDFNLINNFTFLIQLGAGLPALVSLVAGLKGWTLLGGAPWASYFELGAYYLVEAGAINYFAACNLYDRHVGGAARPGRSGDESA